MTQTVFGEMPDGQLVRCIRLTCGSASCEIITYGAAVRSLRVPDGKGGVTDVVLGYDSLEQYRTVSGRFGAVMGRCANRVSYGRFSLNGVEHNLTLNRGEHHIHGGNNGFDHRVWSVSSVSDSSVTLWLVSSDGEEGYPGEMGVSVTYTLTENSLRIDYLARSDADTVCNMTNHSYFNLKGHGKVDDHEASLFCDRYTVFGDSGIPTGEIAPVEGTRFDLRGPVLLSEVLGDDGFDQNYMASSEHVAHVRCAESGLSMDVFSDLPAIQFYTGNGIKEGTKGKDGAVYGKFSGLCFEAQFCPDSPNRPEFPSVVLKKDEEYRHFVEYRFSC